MKRAKIGWNFPPTNGGREDGFNDAGIATFVGRPLQSLAREIIQNSLDARQDQDIPVHIDFEIIDLTESVDFGRDELQLALESCLQASNLDGKAIRTLENALQIIDQPNIPCLRVSDRNTTGLRGEHWRALVKMQGTSIKDVSGAAGSHGIGKYAPFANSPLRTVFYWTHFLENGDPKELFQGRSILLSHKNKDDQLTQGTGFYGYKDGCRELTGNRIPRQFRLQQGVNSNAPVPGTAIWITGFHADRDWRNRIAESVIESFFTAIQSGDLTVMVEPDPENDLYEINRSTLGRWFQKLLLESSDGTDNSYELNRIKEAQHFWDLVAKQQPAAEKQDPDLGHCRLWISVRDELPSKVAFVRRGMLITTQQDGLRRFPGMQDFAAVCIFDAEVGNELLRKMENPQHDQFEPARLLEEGEIRRGKRALNRIREWIRNEIRKLAAPPRSEESNELVELAEYLPDIEPDSEFDSVRSSGIEPKEGSIDLAIPLIHLKPHKKKRFHQPPNTPGINEAEDDGEDFGNFGSGDWDNDEDDPDDHKPPKEQKNRNGKRKDGTQGGYQEIEALEIEDFRLVPIDRDQNLYRVNLTVKGVKSGDLIHLRLTEAGDWSTIKRSDLQAIALNGRSLSLNKIRVPKEKLLRFDVTSAYPIGGRAWHVEAERVKVKTK